MPELPEVETTLQGIKPYLEQQDITSVVIRQHRLRWPIPNNLPTLLKGARLSHLERRGKYILFHTTTGTLLLHLGMSGKLCILSTPEVPKKHDHVDIHFANQKYLRFTDPRRFGALLWTAENPFEHSLLYHIGPEPLSTAFCGTYLWEKCRNKKTPIKNLIMDSHIVAGVGNIYATEALFAAHIRPQQAAAKLSLPECEALVKAIKTILQRAIKKGGTTLKDFTRSDGSPGYFAFELKAYGREKKPCTHCDAPLKSIRLSGRSTVYCGSCQK